MKLKNIKTGSVLRQTNKVQDNLEDVSVEYKEVQFLYADAESYAFMDTKTYEQFSIPSEGEEEKRDFLKDGENYQVVFWEQTPIDIKLPTKMVFTVSEAERAERGDTVSGATKVITCETGFEGESAPVHQDGRPDPREHRDEGIPGAGEQLALRPPGAPQPDTCRSLQSCTSFPRPTSSTTSTWAS